MLALLLDVPADPLVVVPQLDGRRAEPQAAEPAVLGADEIAHLCAHHDPGALRVFAHQLIPQAQALGSVNLDQLQCANATGLFGHIKRCCHGGAKTPWRSALPGPRRITSMPNGQDKMSGLLQLA